MRIDALKNVHAWLTALYRLRLALSPTAWRGDAGFVDATYRLLLRRDPDPGGRNLYFGMLVNRRLTRTQLVQEIQKSSEFMRLHPRLPLPDSWMIRALHHARCLLIQQELPLARSIVDLGGACAESLSGALLLMGYPHSPREITIIDLPPDQRMFSETFAHLEEEAKRSIQIGSTRVRYLHTSMTDMSRITSASVDMVWSGESIEHVTREEAGRTLREAYRVLRPGGHLCLDTCNSLLTRLHFPDSFIHPEHKYEYTPEELSEDVGAAGFEIKRMLGICPMPDSLRDRRFQPRETLRQPPLSNDPRSGYFFYLEALKPPA